MTEIYYEFGDGSKTYSLYEVKEYEKSSGEKYEVKTKFITTNIDFYEDKILGDLLAIHDMK